MQDKKPPVKAFAPASVGNIGPAFDVLGMAINYNGDTVEASETTSGIKIEFTDNNSLSTDPDENTAGIAAKEVMKKFNIKSGVHLKLKKCLPCGSGLGSSAASAVAAGYAVASLFIKDFDKHDLIEPITKAEEKVSGAFFCDNTASSLLGGVVLTKSYEPLEVFHLGSIEDIYFAFVKPDVQILTEESRKIIPKQTELDKVKINNANTAGKVTGIMQNDKYLFGRSIDDRIVEPNRAKLIKGFDHVKNTALQNNALGASISGGGPTVFAACADKHTAEEVGKKMKDAFSQEGVESYYFVSKMDTEGARIIGE